GGAGAKARLRGRGDGGGLRPADAAHRQFRRRRDRGRHRGPRADPGVVVPDCAGAQGRPAEDRARRLRAAAAADPPRSPRGRACQRACTRVRRFRRGTTAPGCGGECVWAPTTGLTNSVAPLVWKDFTQQLRSRRRRADLCNANAGGESKASVSFRLDAGLLHDRAPFAISEASRMASSARVEAVTGALIASYRCFTDGCASAASVSSWILVTISAGVLAGTNSPHQVVTSYPGTVSPMVGISGAAGERLAEVTANPLIVSLWTCGSTPGRLLNIASARAGMRWFRARPAPR